MNFRSPAPPIPVFIAALTLAAGIVASAAEQGTDRNHPALLGPEDWAEVVLGRCSDREERWQQSLATLRAHLKFNAQSGEQLDFPDKEYRAYRQRLREYREEHFNRLKFLLHGEKAGFLDQAARRFRAAARPRDSSSGEPFQKTLRLLFPEATPCSLAALENTLFFAVFDLPFSREKSDHDLTAERLFAELDEAYHDQVRHTGSVEGAYRALRPGDLVKAFRHVSEIVARMGGMTGCETDEGTPLQREQLGDEPEGATRRPRSGSSFPCSATATAEARALKGRLEEFFRLAAEPLRIQTYLHSKLEQVEGALRINIPDNAGERLLRDAEKVLFPNVSAMGDLASRQPDQVLALLKPVTDRWFQEEALPAVQKALYDDPFSAYWFYVQTGMAARRPYAYRGSRVSLGPTVFELATLKRFKLHDAIERLGRERVPDGFLDAHASLEEALTQATMTRQEALRWIKNAGPDPKSKAKLGRYVENLEESATISTMDLYRWKVRDASKFEGSVDRDLVRAAMEMVHSAKRRRLQEAIRAKADSIQAGDSAGLTRYLQNAGSLMLELELTQATEGRFQEQTGGGFVGWLLRQLVISGGFPVQLWAPHGVAGEEFAELVDELSQKNKRSGNKYRSKGASEAKLIRDGGEYRAAVLEVISSARNFLNISQFSWKVDDGGKEVAYRLMGKKLGIEGASFDEFLESFREGLPSERARSARLRLCDIPSDRMKNLLFYYFVKTTNNPAVAAVRHQLESALGGELACPSVANCGDLSPIFRRAGRKYRPERMGDASYRQAWEAYRQLQGLFEDKPPEPSNAKPRLSLSEYVADGGHLRRFVRRYGRKRDDAPAEPFPINIFVDGKDHFANKRLFKRSGAFPYFYQDALRDLYYPLAEFDVRVMLWKGPLLEFPWHLGPLPLPGRKILGLLPVPFIPYPWLSWIFTGLGPKAALFLQWALVSDLRNWWAMANHSKNVSSEAVAIESGMGFGSKYFNRYPGFKTWHDMGIMVRGPVVGDVNDAFVQMFDAARVNNGGLLAARGVKIPRLAYEDYRYRGENTSVNRSWVITTNPELHDYNYRGILMAALAAARKNIYIENFYLSDPLVARMLIRKAREFRGRVNCGGLTEHQCSEAKREGVKIYVVFPDRSDQPNADLLSTLHRHEMLHLGVKFYRWNPLTGWSAEKMLHTKVWMVDYEEGQPALTYVGSSNLSQRSHLTDNELGILTTSPSLAREVHEHLFEVDTTTGSQLESPENFHIVWSSNRAVRAARWLQFFLVSLTWAF